MYTYIGDENSLEETAFYSDDEILQLFSIPLDLSVTEKNFPKAKKTKLNHLRSSALRSTSRMYDYLVDTRKFAPVMLRSIPNLSVLVPGALLPESRASAEFFAKLQEAGKRSRSSTLDLRDTSIFVESMFRALRAPRTILSGEWFQMSDALSVGDIYNMVLQCRCDYEAFCAAMRQHSPLQPLRQTFDVALMDLMVLQNLAHIFWPQRLQTKQGSSSTWIANEASMYGFRNY